MKYKTELCIPYLNAKLSDEYLLYTVTFDEETDNNWNMRSAKEDEVAARKFRELQGYFEKRHYTHSCPGEFELETLNSFPSGTETHEYVTKVNSLTTSIFLGIFLKATEQLQGREFVDKWQTICATGDLKYDETNGKLRLIPVDDIEVEITEKKIAKSKYNGEFLKLADADENEHEKYLFLSIGDKEESEEKKNIGKHSNITVMQFSKNNTLEDVLNYVFKPVCYNFNYRDFDSWRRKRIEMNGNKINDADYNNLYDLQKNLTNKMEDENEVVNYGYIPGDNFDYLEKEMLKDGWHGFFIYGDGFSGKSATAMTIARYLMTREMIYAPVWINVKDNAINDKFMEEIDKPAEIMGDKPFDKIEVYIASEIYKQFNPYNPKDEIFRQRYLIVIDNLELDEEKMNRILMAISKVFSNFDNKPYLIVTSQFQCADIRWIKNLSIQEIRAPKMGQEQIEIFVKIIAGKFGQAYTSEIEAAEKNESLTDLVKFFTETFDANPGMIISAIELLRDNNFDTLYDQLSKSCSGNKHKLREKMVALYEMSFLRTNTVQKQVLYFFLGLEDDISLTENEIYKKINESKPWKATPIKQDDLTEILQALRRRNILYSPSGDKTRYGMKSIAYYAFLFEEQFLGPKLESGEYLRDIFVDLDLQLEKALQKDQSIEIIEPILKKMKRKNEIPAKCSVCPKFSDECEGKKTRCNHYFSLAARYISNPEVLSLLKNFGCDISATDNFNRTPFLWAARLNSQVKILDWFADNGVAVELDRSVLDGNTIMHFAAGSNQKREILEWLKNHQFAINEKNIHGNIPFQWAVKSNINTEILDFFYENGVDIDTDLPKIKKTDLLKIKENTDLKNNKNIIMPNDHLLNMLRDQDEEYFNMLNNVIPYNRTIVLAINNPNIEVFRWMLAHKADTSGLWFSLFGSVRNTDYFDLLFNYDKNIDNTMFEYNICYVAIGNVNTTALTWIMKKNHKFIYDTVFHDAAISGDISILEWLFKNVPHSLKLLKGKDKDGLTVFHRAANLGNVDVLNWFFDPRHILHPQKLLHQKDKYGATVFDYAIVNNKIAVLNWFFEHIPQPLKLLKYKNRVTIFHCVVENNKVAVLDWLFQRISQLNIDERTKLGYTALNLAIQKNASDIVKRLLHKKAKLVRYKLPVASIDEGWDEFKYKLLCSKAAKINRWTKIDIFPLMEAVICNKDTRILKMLLSMGYPPDARNKLGQTPLMAAALNPDPQVAITLMEYDASLEAQDCNGKTALSYIKEHEQSTLILEKDFSFKRPGNDLIFRQIFDSLSKKAKDMLLDLIKLGGHITIDRKTSKQNYNNDLFINGIIKECAGEGDMLIYAIPHNCLRFLLQPGYYDEKSILFEKKFIEPKLEAGKLLLDEETALALQLERALFFDKDKGVVKLLLEKIKSSKGEIDGKYLLYAAQYSTKTEIFSLLINDFGCNINVCDEDDRNVFNYVVYGKNLETLNWFFQQRPDLLSHKTEYGITVFHSAAGSGNIPVLEWLFDPMHIPHPQELLNHVTSDGLTVFHYAAQQKNIAVLDWFLEHTSKELLNCVDNEGGTVFHYAAIWGNIDVLDWFFEHTSKGLINLKDSKNRTVFHYAAGQKNVAVLDWFLKFADKDLLKSIDNNGFTIFHHAVALGNTAVLDWLLKYVPDMLNHTTDSNREPLFNQAVMNESTAVLDWLFEHIPQPQEQLIRADSNGATVFHRATGYGNIAVLDWLWENAPKELLNQTDDHGCRVFHYAVTGGNTAVLDWLWENAPKELLDQTEFTIFYYAVIGGSTDVLEWLWKHVPKELLAQTDDHGFTVFHCATGNGDGNADVLDWLLDRTSEELLCQLDDEKKTVFHYASGNGNTDVLDWLLDHPSKELLEQTDDKGKTVFHYALGNGNADVLDWLLDHTSEELLRQPDDKKETVFHCAAKQKNDAVLDWLLENVPDLLNSIDDNEKNVFHHAAGGGSVAVLNWFLERMPKEWLNNVDKNKKNVFHHAAEGGNTEVLDWFLAHTSDELLKQTDDEGRTAFHYAAGWGNADVMDWLLEHIKDLLNCVDKNGKNIFHYYMENGNSSVFSWFRKNAPEMIKWK